MQPVFQTVSVGRDSACILGNSVKIWAACENSFHNYLNEAEMCECDISEYHPFTNSHALTHTTQTLAFCTTLEQTRAAGPGQNSSRDYNSSPTVQSSLKGVGHNLSGLGD